MWVAGIDENGLGPVLGPLVVTGVLFEAPRYDSGRWRRVLRPVGVDDSKKVAAFGAVEEAAATATEALFLATGEAPRTFADLVRAASREGEKWLREPCPDAAAPQCWSGSWVLPRPTGALARALDRLGARLVAVQATILCPSRLRDALADGRSKLAVDLDLFERLVLALREHSGADATFLCGKVGARKDYDSAFGVLGGYLRTTMAERRRRSAYRIAGVGEVHFVLDGDASEPPIALASIVGKVLREGFVDRLNRFYAESVPGLVAASGYRDPVTRSFVEKTKAARARLRVPDRCFLRVR